MKKHQLYEFNYMRINLINRTNLLNFNKKNNDKSHAVYTFTSKSKETHDQQADIKNKL